MREDCKQILSSAGALQDPQRKIGENEGIPFDSYDASENNFPEPLISAKSLDEINLEIDLSMQKKFDEITERRRYLWVIDDSKIRMILESTECSSSRGCVCHTNITGEKKAIVGGELWFLKKENEEDITMYINFDSGRYPLQNHDTQIPIVVELFKCVGYKIEVLP